MAKQQTVGERKIRIERLPLIEEMLYLPRELGGLTRERGGGGKGKLVVSGCELEELMPLLLGLPRSVSESEDESPYEANKASIFFLEKYKASILFLGNF